MKLVEMLPESSEFIGQLTKKLAPPMVTLLSAEPEIQYVALRNINLIVQKRFFLHVVWDSWGGGGGREGRVTKGLLAMRLKWLTCREFLTHVNLSANYF